MVSIARKNLFHDKIRFLIALAGIQFAVVLITVQVGVFLQLLTSASFLIDHNEADIWITSKNVQNFEFARPISERKFYLAKAVPGVLWAEKYLLSFAIWKLPNGSRENVQVVGFNPDNLIGAPWNMAEGNPKDVKYFNSVIILEAEREKLGNLRVGDETEINDRKVRVVGITRGAKSFIQSAYVFTSFNNAINLSRYINKDQTIYILVKVAPGFSVEEVKNHLQEQLSDVDVYTKKEFSTKTRKYWIINTGAGIALLSTALLGAVVGIIIVGQTIYASTMEHIKEFGTLKAIGASNRDIYKIIIEQALINSVIGYAVGVVISYLVVKVMQAGKLDVLLPWPVMALIFVVTVLMCVSSSIISIYKVTKIDPALIFKS